MNTQEIIGSMKGLTAEQAQFFAAGAIVTAQNMAKEVIAAKPVTTRGVRKSKGPHGSALSSKDLTVQVGFYTAKEEEHDEKAWTESPNGDYCRIAAEGRISQFRKLSWVKGVAEGLKAGTITFPALNDKGQPWFNGIAYTNYKGDYEVVRSVSSTLAEVLRKQFH